MDSSNNQGETTEVQNNEAAAGVIDVVSREAGSGTRSAFEEIIGFNGDGKDPMTANATIKDGNGVVATYVAGNECFNWLCFIRNIRRNKQKLKD